MSDGIEDEMDLNEGFLTVFQKLWDSIPPEKKIMEPTWITIPPNSDRWRGILYRYHSEQKEREWFTVQKLSVMDMMKSELERLSSEKEMMVKQLEIIPDEDKPTFQGWIDGLDKRIESLKQDVQKEVAEQETIRSLLIRDVTSIIQQLGKLDLEDTKPTIETLQQAISRYLGKEATDGE